MTRKGHVCPNSFLGDGAQGGCYFEIQTGDGEGVARLDVGWSCVVVYQQQIPISWLAELIAIASSHKGGVAGFLREHDYGNPSYALMCDPTKEKP